MFSGFGFGFGRNSISFLGGIGLARNVDYNIFRARASSEENQCTVFVSLKM